MLNAATNEFTEGQSSIDEFGCVLAGMRNTDRKLAMISRKLWTRPIAIGDIALAALAVGSGATDVTAFVMLGDVFTSAMTGNTALLGIALSQGQLLSAAHAFSALLGFVVGAAVGASIYLHSRRDQPGNDTLRVLLLVESLFLAAFACLMSITGPPGASGEVFPLILLSAIGMGVQGVAARHINSPGINTIVFTSTLVSIVFSLVETTVSSKVERYQVHADTKRQISIFLAYACGSIAAGLLAGPGSTLVAWIPLLAVLAALGCGEAAIRTGKRSA